MSAEPIRRPWNRPQMPEAPGAAPHGAGQRRAPGSGAPVLAWSSPAEYFRLALGRSPLVFVLGMLLIVEDSVPALPAALPVSETVMGILIVGTLLRSGRLRPVRLPLVMALLSAAFLWLLAVSIAADVDWTRRMVRIGMLFWFALVLATGRVPLRPLVLGMGAGLLVNAVLFYAGIAPDNYGGALSGYLMDKNVAGFVYAIVPLLIVPFLPRRWQRWLCLAVGLLLVFQTGSRTGLAAMILAVAWIALGGRGGPFLRAALLAVFYVVFIWAERNLATLDVFGDRTGTDWFRERIDEAAWTKTQGAMPWGDGAGEAVVTLPPDHLPFFFHNSYWALIVEGGIPLLALVVAAFALGGFGAGAVVRTTRATTCAQASVIVVLLVAFRLGEVFLTVPAMVVLGGSMALWELERHRRRQERRHERLQGTLPTARARADGAWVPR